VSAVEKSSLDTLEELKKTDATISISLRAELDAERKKYKAIKDEYDNSQKQLLTAFIEKDQLRREVEEASRKAQAAHDGQGANSADYAKQGEKLEKLRVKAKELKEVRLLLYPSL
jgi:protein HOOK3